MVEKDTRWEISKGEKQTIYKIKTTVELMKLNREVYYLFMILIYKRYTNDDPSFIFSHYTNRYLKTDIAALVKIDSETLKVHFKADHIRNVDQHISIFDNADTINRKKSLTDYNVIINGIDLDQLTRGNRFEFYYKELISDDANRIMQRIIGNDLFVVRSIEENLRELVLHVDNRAEIPKLAGTHQLIHIKIEDLEDPAHLYKVVENSVLGLFEYNSTTEYTLVDNTIFCKAIGHYIFFYNKTGRVLKLYLTDDLIKLSLEGHRVFMTKVSSFNFIKHYFEKSIMPTPKLWFELKRKG